MPRLHFMMMDWQRFFGDGRVLSLSAEAKGIYLMLLGRMWLNDGWIAADDRIVARVLRLDVRSWRKTYKPVIEPLLTKEIAPLLGPIYSQKRLQEVRAAALDLMSKRQAQTERARAAKAAKSGRRSPVTKSPGNSVTRPVTAPAAENVTSSKSQPQKKENSSALQAENYSPQTISEISALPPRDQPLAAAADEPALAAVRSELTKRLVSDGLKRPSLSDIANMGKRS